MRNDISIGPSPYEEHCAQVGEPGYREKALEECARFIWLLWETCGSEPEGASLSVQWFPHDFGEYAEVVCHFNPDIHESVAYASRCEEGAPATWEG